MKQFANRMCESRGWHTPEKGKDYHGNNLAMGHVRAWSKDRYHILLHNAKESYVAACALAILEAKSEEQQKMQSLQDTISKCKMLLQQKAEQKERLEQMMGKLPFGTYCVVWGIIGIALFNWVMGM